MIIGKVAKFRAGSVRIGPNSRFGPKVEPVNIFRIVADAQFEPAQPPATIDLTPDDYEVVEATEEE